MPRPCRWPRAAATATDISVTAGKARRVGLRATVDPEKEAEADFQLIGKMQTDLARLQADLEQQLAVAPDNPGINSTREKVVALSSAIDRMKLQVVGGDASLASKLAEYEKLTLQRQFAAQGLTQAVASLIQAKQDAQEQHLYVQRIAEPNLTDEASYPRRLLWTLATLMASLAIYWIVRTMRTLALEHRA